LKLDASTLLGNESLLLAYESLVQELLFARKLETNTGESGFHFVKNFSKRKASHFLTFLHVQLMEHHQ